MAVNESIRIALDIFGRDQLRALSKDIMGVHHAAQQLTRTRMGGLREEIEASLKPFAQTDKIKNFQRALQDAIKAPNIKSLDKLAHEAKRLAASTTGPLSAAFKQFSEDAKRDLAQPLKAIADLETAASKAMAGIRDAARKSGVGAVTAPIFSTTKTVGQSVQISPFEKILNRVQESPSLGGLDALKAKALDLASQTKGPLSDAFKKFAEDATNALKQPTLEMAALKAVARDSGMAVMEAIGTDAAMEPSFFTEHFQKKVVNADGDAEMVVKPFTNAKQVEDALVLMQQYGGEELAPLRAALADVHNEFKLAEQRGGRMAAAFLDEAKPATEKLAAALRTIVPGGTTIIPKEFGNAKAVKEALNELTKLRGVKGVDQAALEPLIQQTAELLVQFSLAEQRGNRLAATFVQNLKPAADQLIAAFEKMGGSVAKDVQQAAAAMASLEKVAASGGLTSERLGGGLVAVQKALQSLGPATAGETKELTSLREALQKANQDLMNFVHLLKGAKEEEKDLDAMAKGQSRRSPEEGGRFKALSSVMQGFIAGQSLLQGQLMFTAFSLVFASHSIFRLLLAAAAATVVVGFLTKALKGLTAAAISNGAAFVDQLIHFQALTGSQEEMAAMMSLNIDLARKYKQPLDAMGDSLAQLLQNGLVSRPLMEGIGKGAAALGMDVAELTRLVVTGVGKQEGSIESLNKVLGVEAFKLADVANETSRANRVAVVADALNRKFANGADLRARTLKGATQGLKTEFQLLFSFLGAPLIQDVIVPLLNALTSVVRVMADTAKMFVASESASRGWAEVLANLNHFMDLLFPKQERMNDQARNGTIVVLTIILKLLILSTRALIVFAHALRIAAAGARMLWSFIKGLIDALRQLLQFLKSLIDPSFLGALKDFFLNLPSIIAEAIKNALAALDLIARFVLKLLPEVDWKDFDNKLRSILDDIGLAIGRAFDGIAKLVDLPVKVKAIWDDIIEGLFGGNGVIGRIVHALDNALRTVGNTLYDVALKLRAVWDDILHGVDGGDGILKRLLTALDTALKGLDNTIFDVAVRLRTVWDNILLGIDKVILDLAARIKVIFSGMVHAVDAKIKPRVVLDEPLEGIDNGPNGILHKFQTAITSLFDRVFKPEVKVKPKVIVEGVEVSVDSGFGTSVVNGILHALDRGLTAPLKIIGFAIKFLGKMLNPVEWLKALKFVVGFPGAILEGIGDSIIKSADSIKPSGIIKAFGEAIFKKATWKGVLKGLDSGPGIIIDVLVSILIDELIDNPVISGFAQILWGTIWGAIVGAASGALVGSGFLGVGAIPGAIAGAITGAVIGGLTSAGVELSLNAEFREAVFGFVEGVFDFIGENIEGFLIGGGTTLLFGGLPAAVSVLISGALGAVIQDSALLDSAIDVGESIVNGILSGVESAATAVYDFFKGLADEVIGFVKAGFEIFSPSRRMARLGNDIMDGLLEGLVSIFPEILAFFTGFTPWEWVMTAVSTFITNTKTAFTDLLSFVDLLFFTPLKTAWETGWNGLTTFWTEGIQPFLTDTIPGIFDDLLNGPGKLFSLFGDLLDASGKGWRWLWEEITTVASDAAGFLTGDASPSIPGYFEKMFEKVTGFFEDVLEAPASGWRWMWTEIANVADAQRTFIEETIPGWFSAAWNTLTTVMADIHRVITEAFTEIKDYIENVLDFDNFITNTVVSWFSSLWETLLGGNGWVTRIKSDMETAFGAIKTTIVEAFGALPELLETPFNDIISQVLNPVLQGFEQFVNAIRGAINWISGKLHLGDVIGGYWDVPDVDPLARGTSKFKGGMALVGEQGPELALLPQNAAVMTAGATARALEAAGKAQEAGVPIGGVFDVPGDVIDQIGDLGKSILQGIIEEGAGKLVDLAFDAVGLQQPNGFQPVNVPPAGSGSETIFQPTGASLGHQTDWATMFGSLFGGESAFPGGGADFLGDMFGGGGGNTPSSKFNLLGGVYTFLKDAIVGAVKSGLQLLADLFQAQSETEIQNPLPGARVSQEFGITPWSAVYTNSGGRHTGVDLEAGHGSPVFAPAKGIVKLSTYQGAEKPAGPLQLGVGFGNMIVIQHPNGLETLFGHLSGRSVTPFQNVERGKPIGFVGSTGFATGPHLHFETRQDGELRNPRDFVNFATGGIMARAGYARTGEQGEELALLPGGTRILNHAVTNSVLRGNAGRAGDTYIVTPVVINGPVTGERAMEELANKVTAVQSKQLRQSSRFHVGQ